MSQPVDLLDLFVRSPGELLYFFTVIALSLASLFMALGQRIRRPDDRATQRYTTAMFGVVLVWVALMAGAVIARVSDVDTAQILPPIERLASVVTILCMFWAFSPVADESTAKRLNDLLSAAVGLAVVGYILTAIRWWGQAGEIDFNLSVLGATWTLAASALSILGVLIIGINMRAYIDAPLKILFFLILAVGNTGTLIQVMQANIIGDYAGPPRIAFAAALVIVPALIYRSILLRLETDVARARADLMRRAAEQPPPAAVVGEPRTAPVLPAGRESSQLLRALGIMLENATSATIPQRIIHAVQEVLRADVVALLRQNDANYSDVVFAYDYPLEREIDGISLNLSNQPTLVDSIERMAGRSLDIMDNRPELQDLYTRLDIDQVGPAAFQPLVKGGQMVGVLLVANPYSNRNLSEAEADLLQGISLIAAGLLQLAYAATDAEMLAQERRIQSLVHGTGDSQVSGEERLQLARQQIGELSRQITQLKIELDDERTRVISDLDGQDDTLSISQQMRVLNSELEGVRDERDQLAERLAEAEAALQSAFAGNENVLFDQIVNSLQHEKRKLSEEKDRLEQELLDLRGTAQSSAPEDLESLLNRMSVEKVRLEEERDRTSVQLDEIRSQLKDLGIDDSAGGLAHVISQLNEQRLRLQRDNARLINDRNELLEERTELQSHIEHKEEQKERIKNLEVQIQNLAGDREVAQKQQEKMRIERDELAEKLDTIKQHRARLLAQNTGYEIELREIMQEQRALREKIEELTNMRSELVQERDRLLAEKQATENERDQLMARIDGDRDRLKELGTTGVGSLTGMIEELTEQRSDLEHELSEARTKLANVEEELASLKRREQMIEEGDARYRPENPALLLGLVQELRTPMTSIIGYVDLLLGESAGILGEMQRKFMQRVSTNVKRLSSMVDDLVHVTELDAGTFPFEPAPVDVTSLIEDAITNASVQFREKGLVINLNLADSLPTVHGDKDSISQILGQLLTNAYLVSPPNTEVTVTALEENCELGEKMVDCLHVSVEDRGGGITEDNAARVFARKYKAENPLIQGLGDTGVGLSIARALVEAHGGRLWLESEENVGTTFSFVIPIGQIAEPEG